MNDAPAGTDNSKTINEDASYTFLTADFGFSDANDTPANSLAAVKITTLASNGVLKLNGVVVTLGQEIVASEIIAGNLKFFADANENGTPYGTFTFQVHDNGGTANGGVDLDQAANTFTFNVTAVNDAPAVANDVLWVSNSTVVTLPVTALLNNDTDVDGLALSITSLSLVSGTLGGSGNDGDFAINPNGTFSFTTGATGGRWRRRRGHAVVHHQRWRGRYNDGTITVNVVATALEAE